MTSVNLSKIAAVKLSVRAGSCFVERDNMHLKHIPRTERCSLEPRRVNRDTKIRINLAKFQTAQREVKVSFTLRLHRDFRGRQ